MTTRTIVRGRINPHTLHETNKDTEIDEYGKTLSEIKNYSLPGQTLYHIDVHNPVDSKKPLIWKPDSFHTFAIRTTVKHPATSTQPASKSVHWRYVGFFNRPATDGGRADAINRYLRHLTVGNICIDSKNPIQQRRLDLSSGVMKIVKGGEIATKPIESDELLPEFFRLRMEIILR